MNDPRSTIDYATLIPELSRWNGGKGIDVESWLRCTGSYELAIAYGALFWPTFTLHDECVLFADFSDASFHGLLSQFGGDRRSVESVMNHRHILDLFPRSLAAPTRDQVLHLGRTLQGSWTSKLREDFPVRNIVVSFREEGIEDLLEYQITFFQERSAR